MKRRILSLLLAMSLMIGLFPIAILNVEAATFDATTVVSIANASVGTTGWQNLCLSFVRHCFKEAYGFNSSDCCAYNYGSSHIDSTSRDNIPLGADVFFGGSTIQCSGCGNKAGHVAIYVGNGYIVHSWGSAIKKTTIDAVINAGYPYRGYGWHGNVELSEGYLSKCTPYPSYGELTVAGSCNPHPLPCSNTVAQKYGTTSVAMTDHSLIIGDVVTVNGIVLNTENHYWYKVTLNDGTPAYIYSGDAGSYLEQKWPYVNGSIMPDSISDATFLSGTVVTGGSLVESVQAFVYRGTAVGGQPVIKSDADAVSTTSTYPLNKSDVDYSLPFQDLKAYGNATYTISIEVAVTNYRLDGNGKPEAVSLCRSAGTDSFSFIVSQSGSSTPTASVVDAALQLLYYNEGSYGSINKNDNGAVSIGKIQWHGNRALELLKKIVNMDTSAAQTILGSALYNEIRSATDWSKRTVTSSEANALSNLLTTANGKAAQDSQATADVTGYINHGQNLGITDAAALIYFADLENQGGGGMSERVARAAANTAGSFGAVTLDILHQAALADSVAGQYAPRRNKTYNYCLSYVGMECYVLTLKANYGECATKTISVKKGNSIGELPNATHASMRFEGWYTAPFGGERVTADTVPTSDMTIYAHYSYLSAEVNFDCNGGALPSSALSRIVDRVNDGRPGESLVVFTKAGTSPNTNIYGSEIAVNEQGKIVAVRKYGEEQQLTVPEGGFILSGQVGWDEDKRENVGGGPEFIWIIVDDMVDPYVSFNAETGEAMAFDSYTAYLAETKRADINTAIGELPVPMRDGYIFNGWYTAATGGTKVMSEYKVSSDITLYAHWVRDCSGGHTYQAIVTAPTCTEQGYTTYTCSECGETYISDYTPILNHSWDSGILTTPATCTQEGIMTYTCTVCGTTRTEVIPQLDHAFTYSVTASPTGTTAGVLTGTCGNCGEVTPITLPVLNTTDYTYTVEKEATYQEAGLGRYTWKTTTYGTFFFDVTIPKLNATLTKIEVASRPTKTVYEIGEALDTAGLTLKATYSDGSTKTVTTGFTTSGFSSATAGEKTVTVTYEGLTATFTVTVQESQVVDPTAPQLVVDSIQAVAGDTVTVTLSLVNSPSFGGMAYDVYFDTDILELVSYELDLGSTICTDSGMDTYSGRVNFQYASTDNITGDGTLVTFTFKVKEDAPTGFTAITVVPEDGTSFYYDGRKEVDFTLAAANGGIEIIDYIKGDINGDGKVNNRDAARLMQYLAGWDVEYVNAALDVNGDGKVNNRDAARLMQYLAGWEVEIH